MRQHRLGLIGRNARRQQGNAGCVDGTRPVRCPVRVHVSGVSSRVEQSHDVARDAAGNPHAAKPITSLEGVQGPQRRGRGTWARDARQTLDHLARGKVDLVPVHGRRQVVEVGQVEPPIRVCPPR